MANHKHLTLHSNFMLAFLRDANTARSVTVIVNDLYDKLGTETYRDLFPVILTDRVSQFSIPKAIEADAERNLRSLMLYCDPNAPYQKGGGIEVTHEFIRRVIPKGTSLNPFPQKGFRKNNHPSVEFNLPNWNLLF